MLYVYDKEKINVINSLSKNIINLQNTYDKTLNNIELTEHKWGCKKDKQDKEYLEDLMNDINNSKIQLNKLLLSLL
jgi:hypothetical protein